jgi:CHAT domain-containing protein/Tfp pilus assembly protein PilF
VKKFNKLSIKIKLLIIIIIFFLSNSIILPNQKTNSEQEYTELFAQAEELRIEGNFNKSIELFDNALKLTQKSKDEKKQCEILQKLGILFWNKGKLEDSTKKFEQALLLAQKLNLKKALEFSKTALEIYKLYNEAKEFRTSGDYQNSIRSFNEAINLAKKIKSKEHELKCLRLKSFVYKDQNKLKEFKELNDEAVKIALSINHKVEEVRCLINMGIYHYELNNYSEALNNYEKTIDVTKIIGSKYYESFCLNNMGIIYQSLGDYEKALDYLSRALAIDKELGIDISIPLNNIGTSYRTKGLLSNKIEDFQEAKRYFEECLELTRKTGDKNTEVRALNNIGTIYADLGNLTQESVNYHDALKYFQLAYEKANKIKNYESMSQTLNNIAIVHFNLENYEESTKYFQTAIDLALEIRGDQILWEAYLGFAKVYEKQEDYSKAIENYRASINTTENIRSGIVLEHLKAKFLGTDKRIEAYHRLINLLIRLYQDNQDKSYAFEAFDYLERAKARAFLDSLELSKIDISRDADPELLSREKELMKNITEIYSKLLAAEMTPEQRNNLHEELKAYEDESNALKREIRQKSPSYANIRYPQIISLEEAQKRLLDSRTAFFVYLIGAENSYAFAITKNDLKIFPIPSIHSIQNQVTEYLKVINDKDNHNFQLGNELFNQLVFPGLSENIKNIIFVPDDILHFLPFETLITNTEGNDWLIKDYKIAYVPSISSLREITERKNANRHKPRMDLLAFGDPDFGDLETDENGRDIFQVFFSSRSFGFFRLEFSGLEIERISSLFKTKKRTVFRREEASEEQFKHNDLDNYKIIHFATHSIIDDRRPDRSSIVLTLDKDPAEDGFLQMREIYNIKLNADLVTLSSCQTGLGERIRGEGIDGINKAFFYAGSSSILMSLWPVNDEASCQLMERFYIHLHSSNSIMDALRKAKLEMIESGVLSHPSYWAGFIASGKADEVIFPKSSSRMFVIGIVLAAACGAVLFLSKRFRKKTRNSF